MKMRFLLLLLLLLGVGVMTQGQTLSVVHTFTGGSDGRYPTFSGATLDSAGNIYGNTFGGGSNREGVAYKIEKQNGTFNVLYNFNRASGSNPSSPVKVGPGGSLYGSTGYGGTNSLGAVYNLSPPPTFCHSVTCYWDGTALFSFTNSSGYSTGANELAFDNSGNIYGTTQEGGAYGLGTLFELTPNGSGGWNEVVLYSFGPASGPGGNVATGGPAFDAGGNIYVPTVRGGANNCGTVSKLSSSGGTWSETVLYSFPCVGMGGFGTLILDSSNNIFGVSDGLTNEGGVWELTSTGSFVALKIFSCGTCGSEGPTAGLTRDSSGNLYGATFEDGRYGYGNVFKLAAGTFAYSDLYDFTGSTDGAYPDGPVAVDSRGNIYGSTYGGGSGSGFSGYGVVWELTP